MNNFTKFVLFGVVLCFFGLFQRLAFSASLSGPDSVESGTLVKFTSDVEGDWMVYPPGKGSFAKDSGGKILFFTSIEEGEFTLTYFGLENGKAAIYTKTFTVKSTTPSPDPTPKPAPTPDLTLSYDDREACILALESIIEAIDSKTVTTPAGARSYFKQYLLICGGKGEKLRPAIAELTEKWSERMDYSSMSSIRKSFQTFLLEVEDSNVKVLSENWTGKTVLASKNNFDEEVKEYTGLCFVLYGDEYCGPCNKMKLFVEELPIKTVYVDTRKVPEIFSGGQVPRLEIYKNGKKQKAFVGYMSKAQLESKMEEYK